MDFSEEGVDYCKRRLPLLMGQGIPVIFADESCITSKTLPSVTYAMKNENCNLDEKKTNLKCLPFIVALSLDKGFFLRYTTKKSVNGEKFIEFLKDIRKIYQSSPRIAIYIDNASFHKNKIVKKFAIENSIEIVWSPIYRPEF